MQIMIYRLILNSGDYTKQENKSNGGFQFHSFMLIAKLPAKDCKKSLPRRKEKSFTPNAAILFGVIQ